MKELLNRYQARLTGREDEKVWDAVETAVRGGRTKRGSRLFRLPATGLAVVAAAVAITLIVKEGGGPPPIPAPTAVELQKRAEDRLAQSTPIEVHEAAKAPGTEGETVLEEDEAAALTSAIPSDADEFTRVKPEEESTRAAAAPSAVAADTSSAAAVVMPRQSALGSANTGAVSGTVTDAETGAPLPFTNVTVVNTPLGAITYEDGTFEIRNLPPGTYTVRAQYIGYAEARAASVPVTAGEATGIAFKLNPSVYSTLHEAVVTDERAAKIDVKSTQSEHGVSTEDIASLPIEEITDAVALKPGVTARGGELYVRGGRSGDVVVESDGDGLTTQPAKPESGTPAAEPTQEKTWGNLREKFLSANEPEPSTPSVARRDRQAGFSSAPPDAMFFRHYGINPEVWTKDDRRATFALDVDPASYGIVREYLFRRQMPPAAAVRVEEFVNAFPHGYAPPKGDDIAGADMSHRHEGTFAFHLDAGPAPFGEGRVLFRVGLKAREIDAMDRKPVTLTFVIDTSGSMARENRLALVKDMLIELIGQLRHDDEVAIVAYGSNARIVAPVTSTSNRWALEQQIRTLRADGSTNAEAGLALGYQLASRAYRKDRISRVILCSDGVANVGRTGPEAILDVIREETERGIDLTTIGVGMGNYNDVLLERLANEGDGQYYYVNDRMEARHVFVDNLTGTLVTIARDATAQVVFNPDVVTRYRLLGYENRDVADEDFRNDAIDAGEVGSGHEVTALFELVLAGDPPKNDWFARASVRFEDPDTGEVTEDFREAFVRDIARRFDRLDPTFRLDAAVAEFAEILRDSYYAQDADLGRVRDVVSAVAADVPQRDDVVELGRLVDRSIQLRPRGPSIDWFEREAAWERGERP